ncbi:MAG: hypothetical protein EOP86_12230 [Verrucomicrobiaceae bacterium]|nr:MAG: hypothetical protein EOP86_12230 [Verrucomicrobiaceae bacterium]
MKTKASITTHAAASMGGAAFKTAAAILTLAGLPSLHASPGKESAPAPAASTTPAPHFTVHEWGTFTSVSGSGGKLLTGVERGEEDLPYFIYAHDGIFPKSGGGLTKGWLRPLANVTVRMETPVIYFYTDKPFAAQVDVGFKGGSISQWYPQRSAGETAPPLAIGFDGKTDFKATTLDFGKPYQGSIQWKVDVIPAGDDAAGRVFKFNETTSWLHPRQTDSALVRTAAGETEKYLFYRGLGNFQPPVTFTASGDGAVTVRNTGGGPTGELILFENTGGKARWITLPAIQGGQSAAANPQSQPLRDNWRTDVYEEGAKMLERAGLFRKEADAMMQTWWGSYFEREGTRVFWIVPSEFTDKTLPLAIAPAPAKTVRVMVGRTEILTPAFESRLVAEFNVAGQQENGQANPWGTDRFFPAYQERVNQLRARIARASGQTK